MTKKELNLLVCFLSIGLANCAHAVGRNRCSGQDIPVIPQQTICIANASGGGGCYDPRQNPSEFNRDSINNFVCYDPIENNVQEEWVKQIIDSCKGK